MQQKNYIKIIYVTIIVIIIGVAGYFLIIRPTPKLPPVPTIPTIGFMSVPEDVLKIEKSSPNVSSPSIRFSDQNPQVIKDLATWISRKGIFFEWNAETFAYIDANTGALKTLVALPLEESSPKVDEIVWSDEKIVQSESDKTGEVKDLTLYKRIVAQPFAPRGQVSFSVTGPGDPNTFRVYDFEDEGLWKRLTEKNTTWGDRMPLVPLMKEEKLDPSPIFSITENNLKVSVFEVSSFFQSSIIAIIEGPEKFAFVLSRSSNCNRGMEDDYRCDNLIYPAWDQNFFLEAIRNFIEQQPA